MPKMKYILHLHLSLLDNGEISTTSQALGAKHIYNSWVRHLDELLAAEGVETLSYVHRDVDNNIARPWTLAHMLSFIEFKPMLEKETDKTSDGEKTQQPQHPSGAFWERFSQVANEAEAGATTRVAMVHAVGRKLR